MSVHETKFGTWEVKYRDAGRLRSKSFKRKGEAEKWDRDTRRRQATGQAIVRRQDVPTLREFGNKWLAARRLEDSTRAKYAEQLEVHVYPELGELQLVDLRPRRLAEWQECRLEAGAGPAVLGKAQGLLGRILRKAVLPYEYLEANPVDALDPPSYPKREHRWITAAEVESLRGWYLEREDLGSATLISIFAYVGIRPQDALALEWSDVGTRLTVIRRNSQCVIVPGSKTGEGYKRKVYPPQPVAADLKKWRAAGSGSGLIFPRADGEPWRKHDWDNWRSKYKRKPKGKSAGRPLADCFKLAAEQCDLGASLTPYSLRHSAASLYAAAGWTHVEIAAQLGHSPEVSMRTYQHLIDAKAGEGRRSVEDYIREARGVATADGDVLDLFGAAASEARASRSE